VQTGQFGKLLLRQVSLGPELANPGPERDEERPARAFGHGPTLGWLQTMSLQTISGATHPRSVPYDSRSAMTNPDEPAPRVTLDDLPSPWEGVSDEAFHFMLSFDGYAYIRGGPDDLQARIVGPASVSIEKTGRLPPSFRFTDLRALLFTLARIEKFDEGYLETPLGLHLYFAAVDELRARLSRTGHRSG
jgi:hypothetical protein